MEEQPMNKLSRLALAILVLAPGCTGTIVDPDETVATFNLRIDALEALVSQECVAMYGGEQSCTPYPNEMECQTMKIMVKADGRTIVDCRANGQVVRQGVATVGDGIPYICKSNADMSCVTCMDIYGYTIHDNCNRGAQLFRKNASGWGNLGAEGAYLEEPTGGTGTTPGVTPPDTPETPDNPATPDTPPSGGDDECKVENSVMLYAKALNQVLAHEGLNISWVPDLSKFTNSDKGFLGAQGNTNLSCDAFTANIKSKLHKCALTKNGECFYCWNGWGKKTCRCYRVNVAAMKAACNAIPAKCDRMSWSSGLIVAYGVATKWLFSPSYSNFYGQVTPPQGGTPQWPKCKGSPLVLDLAGDGIQASSPAEGVGFDLMGFGELQTAWVRGDDALLALDRNNNGRVDSGTELFGEVTGGLPHEDGFEALATLDTNTDGKVDRRDSQFSRLVLWQDLNRDGRSQRSELTSLGSAGIRSIDLSKSQQSAVDRHGNDLGLQGAFTRTDGSSGLLVDVFFVTGSR
jgi:hypothetical protein